jgi:hypothetical protein
MKHSQIQLYEKLAQQREIIFEELKDRYFWFVRLRWWVPPAIWAGCLIGRGLGVEFAVRAVSVTAAFILGYNLILGRWIERFQSERVSGSEFYWFTHVQVSLDSRIIPGDWGKAGSGWLA